MSDQQQAPTGSSSIREFCERHHLAVSTFYELEKIGEAPRTFRIGHKIRRITYEAERTWVADREGR